MSLRNIVIIGLFVLLGAFAIWLPGKHKTEKVATPFEQAASPSVAPPGTPASAFPTPIISAAARQLPGGPYAPADPRWVGWLAQRKADPAYEWKMPISLYGRVVDQNEQPIPKVEIEVGWTDTSPSGSSKRLLTSDDNGRFSITDARGKLLVVHSLNKVGYEEARASNRHSFEYASFWEPIFYEPDPNCPVILHLRKKGEPAPLVSSEGKLLVNFGTESSIPMPSVSGGDSPSSPLKVTVAESNGKTHRWKAQISVNGGGIIPALTEFPVEAPDDGYENKIALDQDSPQPPGWQDIDEGGWFYIKTAGCYGLLELRQMKGKRTLYYRVSINPKGTRNLE